VKSKYKPYPSYKESGVEWLGEIPEGWEVKALKYLAKIQTGTTPSTLKKDNFSDTQGIPWIKPDELNGFNLLVKSKKFLTLKGLKEARLIKAKSILVCGIGTIGKLGIAGVDLTTNQQINAITFFNKKINDNFSKYMISSSEKEMEKLANGNVVKILNTESQKNILYPYPPLNEQKAIATYLDRATQKIDTLINKQNRLITLLKEKRQALISHAVTKGVDSNGKLRMENGEFKDSGVEWLGKIPKWWKLSKLKYDSYIKARVGWHGLKSEELLSEGDAYVVTGSDFLGDTIDWDNCRKCSLKRYKQDKYIQLKDNDLLVTKDGTIGKIIKVNKLPNIATLNSGVFVIRPLLNKYLSEYYYWILVSSIFHNFIEYYKIGSTIQHLYQATFEQMPYPLPPKEEQKAIATYLDQKTQAIDTLIDKATKSIELLKEKRTALISAVVTGKVDVRDIHD